MRERLQHNEQTRDYELAGNLRLTFPLALMLAMKGGSYRRQNLAMSRNAVISIAVISEPLWFPDAK